MPKRKPKFEPKFKSPDMHKVRERVDALLYQSLWHDLENHQSLAAYCRVQAVDVAVAAANQEWLVCQEILDWRIENDPKRLDKDGQEIQPYVFLSTYYWCYVAEVALRCKDFNALEMAAYQIWYIARTQQDKDLAQKYFDLAHHALYRYADHSKFFGVWDDDDNGKDGQHA